MVRKLRLRLRCRPNRRRSFRLEIAGVAATGARPKPHASEGEDAGCCAATTGNGARVTATRFSPSQDPAVVKVGCSALPPLTGLLQAYRRHLGSPGASSAPGYSSISAICRSRCVVVDFVRNCRRPRWNDHRGFGMTFGDSVVDGLPIIRAVRGHRRNLGINLIKQTPAFRRRHRHRPASTPRQRFHA